LEIADTGTVESDRLRGHRSIGAVISVSLHPGRPELDGMRFGEGNGTFWIEICRRRDI
jgi:hypothetical protein